MRASPTRMGAAIASFGRVGVALAFDLDARRRVRRCAVDHLQDTRHHLVRIAVVGLENHRDVVQTLELVELALETRALRVDLTS